MAKAKKKVAPKKTLTTEILAHRIDMLEKLVIGDNALLLRVEALTAQQEIIIDGFEFIADNARNVFGLQNLALAYDAVIEKLRP